MAEIYMLLTILLVVDFPLQRGRIPAPHGGSVDVQLSLHDFKHFDLILGARVPARRQRVVGIHPVHGNISRAKREIVAHPASGLCRKEFSTLCDTPSNARGVGVEDVVCSQECAELRPCERDPVVENGDVDCSLAWTEARRKVLQGYPVLRLTTIRLEKETRHCWNRVRLI